MNELQVFTNEQFGRVRTTTIDGEPWFAAADVCKALDIGNPSQALTRLDGDEKITTIISNEGAVSGKTQMAFVSEPGLYSLVIGSRKSEAKAFKRWITHDVIPAIRKHGMYATPQTIDNIINDPDFGIRLLTELKNEREKNSALTERNTALEQQIEQDKPFTDFGLAISTCEGSITIKQMAALLCQRGIKTGEKRLFEELRQDGFLCTSGGYYNEPAQRWMEQKLFEVRTSSYTNKYGNEQITRQTLITAKGIEYLMNYYLRKHGLMELLTVHRRQVTIQRGTRA